MSTPKISVVIPCYNVEKYLHQCLDSVVNQTLKDIEIICVNDGSKDSTLSIIQEYAAQDNRIKIIDKPNGGYGESMNRGFDLATGEYLGIIESDDYADLDMFEKLYACAKEHDLDVVKSGFYFYFSKPTERNTPNPIASYITSQRTFCPVTDFESKMEMVDFFNIKPTIWSAIYRKDFIRGNNIRFNETPGASYQALISRYGPVPSGFVWLKTASCTTAKTTRLLPSTLPVRSTAFAMNIRKCNGFWICTPLRKPFWNQS